MTDERALEIKYVPVTAVPDHPANPKDHSVDEIHRSMRRWDFTSPSLVCERTGYLAAGHGRKKTLLAMKAAGEPPPSGIIVRDGVWFWPVISGWESADDTELKAYLVADNQLTTLGGWNNDELAQLLQDVAENSSLDGVGFDGDDLDQLLSDLGAADRFDERWNRRADGTHGDDETPRIEPGQVWKCGDALVVCGDCRDGTTWDFLLAGTDGQSMEVGLLCTDPPYGIAYDGSADVERAVLEDDATPEAAAQLIDDMLEAVLPRLAPGACSYIFAAIGEAFPHVLNVVAARGLFRWQLVWVKSHLNLSRADYGPQHENILFGWKAGAAHQRVADRTQGTTWFYDRPKANDEHPTSKPLPMMERVVLNSSQERQIVADPFMGSGATLVAAVLNGRRAIGFDVHPRYVENALRWLEVTTGEEAVLVHTLEKEASP